MAKETVTRIVCDGLFDRPRCGKPMNGPKDGIILHGSIHSVGGKKLIGTDSGTNDEGEERAICWACFHRGCPDDSVLTETRDALNRSQSTTEDRSYESNYRYERGNGPTGPLAPPRYDEGPTALSAQELPRYVGGPTALSSPHYVGVVAALCRCE